MEAFFLAISFIPAFYISTSWIGKQNKRTLVQAWIGCIAMFGLVVVSELYFEHKIFLMVGVLILWNLCHIMEHLHQILYWIGSCICLSVYSVASLIITTIVSYKNLSVFGMLICFCFMLLFFCFLIYGFQPFYFKQDWYESLLEEEHMPFYLRFSTIYGAFFGLCSLAECCAALFIRQNLINVFICVMLLLTSLILMSVVLQNRKNYYWAEAQRQSNEELKTFMSIVRAQRHDYNIHVQTIHGLLLQNQKEEAKEYVDTLVRDTIAMNRLLPFSDPAISAMVMSFQKEAEEANIPMGLFIENDLGNIATSSYETNRLIGNLLQNALDEVRGLSNDNFGIRLTTLKRGEYVLIQVSNRTQNPDVLEGYSIGRSSKKGHEGIGLASIRRIVSKYGGSVYVRQGEEIVTFVAKIPLKISERNGE